MNIHRRLAMAFAAATLCANAFSQSAYPDKPIKFIVPFPPGGGTDIIARVLSDKLTATLGWKIVVENKPGAGGTVGLDAAAKSAPDGYTMVIGQTSNMSIAPSLMPGLPYDPVKDFVPVTLVSAAPMAIVVGADSPIKTFADLVKMAKAEPGKLLFASSGHATVGHLGGEYLKRTLGVNYKHVSYKGFAQALPDVISGRTHFLIGSVESVSGPVESGQLRAIGVTSTKRVKAWPNVPTVAESGYPDFSALTWFGIAVPAGTPEPIVSRLNTEIVKVLQAPDVKEKIDTQVTTGSAAFASAIKSDRDKWAKVTAELKQ